MKRKTRYITVNNKKYVWWYRLGGKTVVNLSPADDKTAVIQIIFPIDHKNSSSLSAWTYGLEHFPERISMKMNNESTCIKTTSPRMAGLLLEHLAETFVHRKIILYNGFDLLKEIGFNISKVENGLYW